MYLLMILVVTIDLNIPKVTIDDEVGTGASVKALVNGIKSVTLLEGGLGYSDTNPPIVNVVPTKTGSQVAKLKATVTGGRVSAIEVLDSGSGYTFTPRTYIPATWWSKISTSYHGGRFC